MNPGAVWHPSPNFGPRRGDARPDLIVLHYTAMDSARAARDRLCDSGAEVSAHYLIGRDGTLWKLVDEADRAWHAGAGAWRGAGDVNSRSVGIEIDNDGASPFAAAAMDRLEVLLADVRARHAIPPEGVIGHADMAPGRKSDPGPRFDWRRLARGGHAVWPQAHAPVAADAARFDADLDAVGYPPAAAEARLWAFRARFRPGARGPLDGWDAACARDLAARFGVDGARGGG